MCRKNVLTIMAVVMFALAIGQAQAQMQPITVPNSDFELVYAPGQTEITGTVSDWTQGVGPDCPSDVGNYTFSDLSTGTVADIPGWLGYDMDGWVLRGGTYERDIENGNLQGSVSSQIIPDHGIHCYLANGASWGNPAGGLITSAASLGNIAGNTAYSLSMQTTGNAGDKTLHLLANGVIITPTTSSVEPDPVADPDGYAALREISRTYDVADLTSYIGDPITIVLGVGRDPNAFGAQSKFDDVSLGSEFAFKPTGLIPEDGENVAASFNLLEWTLPTPAVPETGTVTCDVWYAEAGELSEWGGYDPNFSDYATQIVDGGTDQSKPVALAELKTYYWRIDLYDDSNPDPQPFLGMVYTFNTQNEAPEVDAGEDESTWLDDGTVDFDLAGELIADDGRPVAAALMWTVTGEPSAGAATFVTDPNDNLDVTVQATQAGTYELTLTADDTVLSGSDTVSILVYADWCDALRTTQSLVPHETDYNGDCVTDIRDFGILAGEWMLLINDVVPVIGLVPNGDFEMIYKPGQTVITGALSEAAWTQGVGPDCPLDMDGTFDFSDETSGTLADIPDWVGYDLAGWTYFTNLLEPPSYERDPNNADRQGSITNQNNRTDGGVNCYLANGGGWGNAVGGMITSAAPVATVAADTAYVISMFAKGVDGTEAPLVLDLLANGVKITPDSSANPALLVGLWREFSRTYDADTMSDYEGQSLTIVVGLGRPLPNGAVGGQLHLDDVAIVGY